MDCLDLQERFGRRYLVEPEEKRARSHDPWSLVLQCRYGHFYPQGGTMVGVATNSRGRVASRLAKLPFVRVLQDGDDGINAAFDVRHFDQVAKIMKPRRRRKLSPKHAAELVERGRKSQFTHGVGFSYSDRRRVQTGRVVLEHPGTQKRRSEAAGSALSVPQP